MFMYMYGWVEDWNVYIWVGLGWDENVYMGRGRDGNVYVRVVR